MGTQGKTFIRPRAGGRGPATPLAVLALVIAIAGGSAYAGSKLGHNSVRGGQIAPDAISSKHTRELKVDRVRSLPAEPVSAESEADSVTLLRRGPFRVYAKCFTTGTGLEYRVLLSTSKDGAVYRFRPDDADSSPIAAMGGVGGFFDTTDPPAALISGSLGDNSLISRRVAFVAIRKPVALDGVVSGFFRANANGSPPGTYGPGKRCLLHAFEVGKG